MHACLSFCPSTDKQVCVRLSIVCIFWDWKGYSGTICGGICLHTLVLILWCFIHSVHEKFKEIGLNCSSVASNRTRMKGRLKTCGLWCQVVCGAFGTEHTCAGCRWLLGHLIANRAFSKSQVQWESSSKINNTCSIWWTGSPRCTSTPLVVLSVCCNVSCQVQF